MVELKVEHLKKLRECKRNFTQTFDLIINISGIDLKKPENRIREKIKLPHKIKDVKICFIVDSLLPLAKQTGHKVLGKTDLDFDKKEGKKLAKEYDFFVVEAPLMPVVAKSLSKYIGPRNKTMIPIAPVLKDFSKVISDLERTIPINLIKNPIIQTKIGTEELNDGQIIENFNACMEKIRELVEKKKGTISSVYIKLSMSKPIKLM